MSEDQGLVDLNRQLDEVCSPLNSINNNESDLTHEVSEDQGLADLIRQLEEACSPSLLHAALSRSPGVLSSPSDTGAMLGWRRRSGWDAMSVAVGAAGSGVQ